MVNINRVGYIQFIAVFRGKWTKLGCFFWPLFTTWFTNLPLYYFQLTRRGPKSFDWRSKVVNSSVNLKVILRKLLMFSFFNFIRQKDISRKFHRRSIITKNYLWVIINGSTLLLFFFLFDFLCLNIFLLLLLKHAKVLEIFLLCSFTPLYLYPLEHDLLIDVIWNGFLF